MIEPGQAINAVVPAQAGIQLDKNAFCFNPLVSRLRGNDRLSVNRCAIF
jgi:hypothetical protein